MLSKWRTARPTARLVDTTQLHMCAVWSIHLEWYGGVLPIKGYKEVHEIRYLKLWSNSRRTSQPPTTNNTLTPPSPPSIPTPKWNIYLHVYNLAVCFYRLSGKVSYRTVSITYICIGNYSITLKFYRRLDKTVAKPQIAKRHCHYNPRSFRTWWDFVVGDQKAILAASIPYENTLNESMRTVSYTKDCTQCQTNQPSPCTMLERLHATLTYSTPPMDLV